MTDPRAARPFPRLGELHLIDEAGAWGGAGFAASGGSCVVGDLAIVFDQPALAWAWPGLGTDSLDGSPMTEPTSSTPHASGPHPPGPHPNGVVDVDHVVATTGDLDRTIDALAGAGLELRRVRDAGPIRQAFFWAGPILLEVVGGDQPTDAPLTPWGIAFGCDDIDRSVAWFGPERCSEARDAVQRGRRIATLRTREMGLSITVALMDIRPSDAVGSKATDG